MAFASTEPVAPTPERLGLANDDTQPAVFAPWHEQAELPAFTPEQIGPYELICPIAIGGMAEVSLARARGAGGFEKLVVIKRIRRDLAANPELVQLFIDEARLAGALDFHHIAQVFDAGMVGDTHFLAMEYVHGENLRMLLNTAKQQGGGIPIADALQIVTGVCAGLHYAHERVGYDGKPLEIIHRDIAPSNVLVSYDGQVKLIDFGIAKAAIRRSHTAQGIVRGRFSYHSPEQCLGRSLDRRSDIFSLAILLYELTTGTKLFAGKGPLDVHKQIVREPIPMPSSRVPGYPRELERIVLKGLARNREARYATARQLQVELEAFAQRAQLVLSPRQIAQLMRQVFGNRGEQRLRAQLERKVIVEQDALAEGDGPTVKRRLPGHSGDSATERIEFPKSMRPLVPRKMRRRPLLGPLARLVASMGLVACLALVADGSRRPWVSPEAKAPAAAAPAPKVVLPPPPSEARPIFTVEPPPSAELDHHRHKSATRRKTRPRKGRRARR